MWTLSGFADEISPDLDVQCDTLEADAIRHLELRGVWDTNVLDLDDDQLERAHKTLLARGIAVSSIGSPIGKIPISDPFGPHLERFGRALQVAALFGAPYIRIFSFFMPAGDDPAVYRDEVLTRMGALAAAAESAGVTLLHENEKHIYGDTPQRCLDLFEAVGSRNLRAAWDPANFVQVGVRPHQEAYSLLRPYVEYVQIKDAVADTGAVVVAGAGDGEISDTITALRDSGFDGFFSLEPHLASQGTYSGFSGPELFRTAVHAFTGLLDAQDIAWT